MIDVSALVTLPGFESASYVVERYPAPTGTDYRGRPVTEDPELIDVVMVTHQATRRQLRRADLDASDDWRAWYSNVEIRSAGQGARPDVVRRDGERWELQNVADYGTLGGIYIALAKRIE